MSETQNQRPQRLESIQALRGIAAFFVLLFHMAAVQSETIKKIPDAADLNAGILDLYGLFSKGYVGVDLFFVISGFIMVYITSHRPGGLRTAAEFVRSRIVRIYPLWWVLCILIIAYYMVLNGRPTGAQNVPEGQRGLYLLKSFLLLPQEQYPIIGQGWTLVHEMYFYAVFALLLFLKPAHRFIGLMVWFVATCLLAASGFAWPVAVNIPTLAGSLMTLEFFAGALMGWLILKRKIVLPGTLALIGLIALAAALATYTAPWGQLMQYGRVMIYTLPFALIVYGLVGREIDKGLRVPSWLVRLGDWSYALYLSHTFILLVVARSLPRIAAYVPEPLKPFFNLGGPGVLDNVVFIVIGITASIAGSAVLYYAVERPSLRALRRRQRTSA